MRLDFLQAQLSSVQRVATKSIMNPLLWFAGLIITSISLNFYFVSILWIQIFVAGVISFLVLSVVAIFVWMCVRDPDRLQSENYQLQRLALLGDDRAHTAQLEAELVPNPSAAALLQHSAGVSE